MSEESIKCPACGADNPSNAKFCMNCGANLQPGTVSIKLIKIDEPQRISFKLVFLVMAVILLLDAILNRYVFIIITQFLPLGIPYFIAFILTAVSLYIITKKSVITFKESILLLLAVVLGLISTAILYILSLTAGVRTYSPLWIVYLIILPAVWKLVKK